MPKTCHVAVSKPIRNSLWGLGSFEAWGLGRYHGKAGTEWCRIEEPGKVPSLRSQSRHRAMPHTYGDPGRRPARQGSADMYNKREDRTGVLHAFGM